MHKKLGVLMQPGGHIELHENPWQAVQHEILEESGYEISQLKILQPKNRIKTLPSSVIHPQPAALYTVNYNQSPDHKHTDIIFALTTTEEPNKQPSEGESQELIWCSLGELDRLDNTQILDNIRVIARHVLTNLLNDWEQVNPNEYET
jgi:8-oxo-dGTP diphosphatase